MFAIVTFAAYFVALLTDPLVIAAVLVSIALGAVTFRGQTLVWLAAAILAALAKGHFLQQRFADLKLPGMDAYTWMIAAAFLLWLTLGYGLGRFFRWLRMRNSSDR